MKPDILKILQLDAVSCITNKEITNGRVNVTGRVDLKILYIPDSDREKIKSIITSFDFTQNVDSKNITDDMTAIIMANVDRAEFSLINSRKLRIKVIVGLDYEVVAEKNVEIAVEAEDCDNAELLKENVKLQNCIGLTETEFSVKESISSERSDINQRDIESRYKNIRFGI